ncbi:MAG: EAL domain-containing protein [Gammaproteobacteria bacterium]
MTDVRVLVVSPAPELASRVNTALRGAGIVVQVEWASTAADAAKQFERGHYDLIFADLPAVDPVAVAKITAKQKPPTPIIGLAEEIDDDLLTKSLKAGLRDLVLSERGLHIAAVARRELEALTAMRAVAAAHGHAETARGERDALFVHSGDALARAEDGIVVESNPAWAELFGEDRATVGTPVMDVFDSAAHPALRAALRKGSATTLELTARGEGQTSVPVSVALRPLGDRGLLEIAIRSGAGQRTLALELERAQREDRDTGLLNRAAFIEAITHRPNDTLVLARIDDFARLVEQMGVLGSDSVAVQFAKFVRSRLDTGCLGGRLEGTLLGLLLPAQDKDAILAWCGELATAIAGKVFEYAGRSTALAASFGVRLSGEPDPGKRLDQALSALRSARAGGGKAVEVHSDAEEAAPVDTVSDAEWAARIKRALVSGHFRLAFQPVASLRGENTESNDTLLRLLDPEQGEVLPGEFLPAAERVGLMTAIDRWVFASAVKTLSEESHRKRGTTIFVRVSDASLKDPTLEKWLTSQLQTAQLHPGRLVFEISEMQAEKLLKEARAHAAMFKALGCGFLLSRFGGRPGSAQMLDHLPIDYVKLDTEMLAGLGRDPARQKSVQALIEQLRERDALSIAPGVEDANNMALLWQLGVDFVQGNYLQEPEVVISG